MRVDRHDYLNRSTIRIRVLERIFIRCDHLPADIREFVLPEVNELLGRTLLQSDVTLFSFEGNVTRDRHDTAPSGFGDEVHVGPVGRPSDLDSTIVGLVRSIVVVVLSETSEPASVLAGLSRQKMKAVDPYRNHLKLFGVISLAGISVRSETREAAVTPSPEDSLAVRSAAAENTREMNNQQRESCRYINRHTNTYFQW